MARAFDGVDDKIVSQGVGGTGVFGQQSDWTLGCWLQPISTAASQRVVTWKSASTEGGFLRLSGTNQLAARHNRATTNSDSTSDSSNVLTNGTWYAVFVTSTESDKKLRFYIGKVDAPVAEVTGYSAQTAGVGVESVSQDRLNLATNNAGTGAFGNVRLGHVFSASRLLTINEMERFRLGQRPMLGEGVSIYLPLDSPTASVAEDMTGNSTPATVTGATVAEDPPVPSLWNRWIGLVLVVSAGEALTKSVSDSGAGADALIGPSASFSLTDISAGSDVLAALSAALGLTDVGAGSDSHTLSAALVATDAGAGTESVVATIQAALSDSGAGADAVQSLSISLAISDLAAAADAVSVLTETLVAIIDSASGVDAVGPPAAQLSVSDAGSGVDTIILSVNIGLADIALGADALAVLSALIAVADSSQTTEPLSVQVSVPIPDAAAGAEAAVISALFALADAAGGTDAVVKFDTSAAVKVCAVLFTYARRAVSFALAQRSLAFAFARRSVEFQLCH